MYDFTAFLSNPWDTTSIALTIAIARGQRIARFMFEGELKPERYCCVGILPFQPDLRPILCIVRSDST
jgi:hypothetical protein